MFDALDFIAVLTQHIPPKLIEGGIHNNQLILLDIFNVIC